MRDTDIRTLEREVRAAPEDELLHDRLALAQQRSGFKLVAGHELVMFLGLEPTTWVPGRLP